MIVSNGDQITISGTPKEMYVEIVVVLVGIRKSLNEKSPELGDRFVEFACLDAFRENAEEYVKSCVFETEGEADD